ncbi:hypothetical protein OUZ56_017115 [Daphnia magna]|uniref:Uncharacterized protein n=1 Tax=Daphnia magna TaxID=35525 RepID=A0ABR0AS79_9CRUS|nr:hypothetical protein OUZ56_017115 [Daphnia magna]
MLISEQRSNSEGEERYYLHKDVIKKSAIAVSSKLSLELHSYPMYTNFWDVGGLLLYIPTAVERPKVVYRYLVLMSLRRDFLLRVDDSMERDTFNVLRCLGQETRDQHPVHVILRQSFQADWYVECVVYQWMPQTIDSTTSPGMPWASRQFSNRSPGDQA